jgi:hypothetical protein
MNVFFSHTSAPLTQRGQAAYISCSFCHFVCAKVAEKVKPLDRSFCSRRNFGLLLRAEQTFFVYDAAYAVLLNSRGQDTGSKTQTALFCLICHREDSILALTLKDVALNF